MTFNKLQHIVTESKGNHIDHTTPGNDSPSVVAMHQPRLVKDTNQSISILGNDDDMVVITLWETRVALQSRLQVAASIPIL